MALTLETIVTAARDRHPAFHKSRVPNAVVARFLTGYQRRLISQASDINAEAFAQQASVMFDLAPENALGTAGAGVGGAPAGLVSGLPVAEGLPAGAAIEVDAESGVILQSPAVVTSATATTLTRAGAGWTVNLFANRYVLITAGPGMGQMRQVLSNTADTLTISTGGDNEQWATVPTTESMFTVVDAPLVLTQEAGAITAMPALAERSAYLVRLTAGGMPYVDLARPLVARFDVGIDLPPHEYILGGTVRDAAGTGTASLYITRYPFRETDAAVFAAYLMDAKLFLLGDRSTWQGIASIDLRYVPIAPALTALTDYFLLGDGAYDALVARAAAHMAVRVNSLPDETKVDPAPLVEEANLAETVFLSAVGRSARAFPRYVRSVW